LVPFLWDDFLIFHDLLHHRFRDSSCAGHSHWVVCRGIHLSDVAITFDAIDVMPEIEIDPVARRTRGLIDNVSLSEEIALLQSDPVALRVFYAEQQDKCIKS
jgi:hypothetical protein